MKIKFEISGTRIMACHDSVLIVEGDDLREELVRGVVQSISTDVEITAGGVTLHLAAWMDPDHWEEDWIEALDEDTSVDDFIAGLVTA